uniref:DUF4837 family protein n=1 Tax=Prevotella sp. GTC17259 TaxID=3236795 RepID=A0AB33J861_9BACT
MKWLYRILFLLLVTASCRQPKVTPAVKVHQPDSIAVYQTSGFLLSSEHHTWIIYPDSTVRHRVVGRFAGRDSVGEQPVPKRVARQLYALTRQLFVTHETPDIVRVKTEAVETDQPYLTVDVYDGAQSIAYDYYLGYPDVVYSQALQRLMKFVTTQKMPADTPLPQESAVDTLAIKSVSINMTDARIPSRQIDKTLEIDSEGKHTAINDTVWYDKDGNETAMRSSDWHPLSHAKWYKIQPLAFSMFKKIPADVVRRNVYGRKKKKGSSCHIFVDFEQRSVAYHMDLSHQDVVYSADFQRLLDYLR